MVEHELASDSTALTLAKWCYDGTPEPGTAVSRQFKLPPLTHDLETKVWVGHHFITAMLYDMTHTALLTSV